MADPRRAARSSEGGSGRLGSGPDAGHVPLVRAQGGGRSEQRARPSDPARARRVCVRGRQSRRGSGGSMVQSGGTPLPLSLKNAAAKGRPPPPPPPESANLAANESASESAARLTRLGGQDQHCGGWHKTGPIKRCSLCTYHSILHGTPQSVLHPKLWFLAPSPNYADSLGPSPTWGAGGLREWPVQVMTPNRMQKQLFGVWRGAGGGWRVGGSAGQPPGRCGGGRWVPPTYITSKRSPGRADRLEHTQLGGRGGGFGRCQKQFAVSSGSPPAKARPGGRVGGQKYFFVFFTQFRIPHKILSILSIDPLCKHPRRRPNQNLRHLRRQRFPPKSQIKERRVRKLWGVWGLDLQQANPLWRPRSPRLCCCPIADRCQGLASRSPPHVVAAGQRSPANPRRLTARVSLQTWAALRQEQDQHCPGTSPQEAGAWTQGLAPMARGQVGAQGGGGRMQVKERSTRERPGGSLRGKKRKKGGFERQFCKKTAGSSYVQTWLVAVGGWRLAVGGGWWWLVAVGGW